MATRRVVFQQRRREAEAAGNQKTMAATEIERRRALEDIGNVFDIRGAIEGKQKQQQISRPITRRSCAQLLANAQTAAAVNEKANAVTAGDGLVITKAAAAVTQKAAALKSKPEQQPPSAVIEVSPDSEKPKPDISLCITKAAAAVVTQKAATLKSKPEQQPPSVVIEISPDSEKPKPDIPLCKKKVQTFTSVLSARSRVACGIKFIEDIDAADLENQLAVVEYIEDLYKFYRLMESSSWVQGYMDSQTEINGNMRGILMDWLIEVHNRFLLMPETLYLTVYIIDQYLSMKKIMKRELQLVGIAGMVIASKYEEIWAPKISDFVCISDRAYCRAQILEMEKRMLDELEWSLTVPTQYVFLLRFLKVAASDPKMEYMAFFYSELALVHYSMIMYRPSMIAAAAVYSARCTLKNGGLPWNERLRRHTGFSEAQILDCAKQLLKLHSLAAENKGMKGVYKKYSSLRRGAVALIPPGELSQE